MEAQAQDTQAQVPEQIRQEIKKELRNLKEIIKALPTERLEELREKVERISTIIDEVSYILSGALSKVSIRFKYDDTRVNAIEIYGFYSGAFYIEVPDATQINTQELEKLLSSPEAVVSAVRVLTSAVAELTKTLLDLIYDELNRRESDP